jgi:hypothetical protein
MDKELAKIYKEAKQDPSLISKIDPDELLSKMNKEKNSYLENKTNVDILNEIKQSLDDEYDDSLLKKEKLQIIKKLVGYRAVDELDALHIGKQTRWIQKYQDKVKLTNGGLLLNTIFTDEGVNLVIKLWNGTVIQVRFDDCLVYQKLSYDEQIILMAYDYANDSI